MLVKFAGSVTPVSAAQPEKVWSPMLVILAGMVMLVRPVPEKAESPMAVTLAGMVTPVSAAQSLKAALPMLTAPDSITTVLIFSLYADHGALSSV